MSKKPEETEINPFEGFDILKVDGFSTTTKSTKDKSEVETPETEEAKKEREVLEALAKAEQEAKDLQEKASEKKTSKKTAKVEKEETEETEEVEEELEEELEEKEDITSKTKKGTSNPPEEKEEEEEDNTSLVPFVSHMAERGILDIEDLDKFDDSEEGLEKVVQQTITNGIEKWKAGYDEDTQKYLKYIEEGGNPKEFHRIYYNEDNFSDMNIDGDVEAQKYVIAESLRAAGWDDEDEIKEEISLYEDSNKLEVKAKSHLSRLQKLEKEQKDLLIKAQEEHAKEERERQKQSWDNFRDGLFKRDEISGFKFSPKMKEDLWDYMTKVVDKKTKETQYQKDSKEKGDEARYIFAYLLKNNWDASKLSKDLKTKVVSDVKKKLSNYTDTRNKIKSGGVIQEEKKEEGNSFAGFKNILL